VRRRGKRPVARRRAAAGSARCRDRQGQRERQDGTAGYGARRGGAWLGRPCGVVNGERVVVVVVTGAELCSVLCCACRGAKEGAGKEKREREKEEGEKREAGEKKEGGGRVLRRRDSRRGRERATRRARGKSCVGGIRGDGRECGVEHAARRGGRGKEKGWRSMSDVRRRKVEGCFGR
jgi:hypothetical protein